MTEIRVEIVLPRDLLETLDIQGSELGRVVKEWVVLALFLEGRISSGKAAEVLGIPKPQFLDLLSQRNLPYIHADSTDLEREMLATEDAAPERQDDVSSETCPVRIVKKGRLWVAEPLEPGEPVTAEMVREVQDWIRDRGMEAIGEVRPEGLAACSLGREPQENRTNQKSKAPEG
ncbi:MAG TPA: UPF0175 family protein [Thermoanaerobaculia bacterium]